MLHVILDSSARTAQLVDTSTLAGHDLTGKTVLDVDDNFAWTNKTVDWATLAIVDDIVSMRAAKSLAIDELLAQALAAGFTPTTGPCAGKILQTRNDSDRTNWLTAKDKWRDKRDAGLGAQAGAVIRTADNEMVVCSYDDGFTTLQAMADWGFALMGNSWVFKDRVAAAADAAALDAIDITTGWQ